MSASLAAFGVRPVWHPSGIIRQSEYVSGVASGYNTNIFTGTPVKWNTSGNIVVTATGADSTVGSFAGCEFSATGKMFVLPYWPANQTYDSTGPALFYVNDDKGLKYEGQANATVAQTANREGINLADASQGSTFTGWSTQSLNATTTGATAATYIVEDIAPIPGNAWGDAFPILRVSISTYHGQLA